MGLNREKFRICCHLSLSRFMHYVHVVVVVVVQAMLFGSKNSKLHKINWERIWLCGFFPLNIHNKFGHCLCQQQQLQHLKLYILYFWSIFPFNKAADSIHKSWNTLLFCICKSKGKGENSFSVCIVDRCKLTTNIVLCIHDEMSVFLWYANKQYEDLFGNFSSSCNFFWLSFSRFPILAMHFTMKIIWKSFLPAPCDKMAFLSGRINIPLKLFRVLHRIQFEVFGEKRMNWSSTSQQQ